ncbi:hypothetical protein SAMN05216559_0138 [Halomicrobium zhouii]|uniref:Uncharacterized protein n=1 Tax=Halomicrobium zhouii TaxID=767519 RepID=A0A1I6K3Q5_9EURY|nr:hypothetical protein [Halomicrobium zhouii]SFR85806.1 hypothetical protein SAMN05216559_0138 [Halomicrobium zhouii]
MNNNNSANSSRRKVLQIAGSSLALGQGVIGTASAQFSTINSVKYFAANDVYSTSSDPTGDWELNSAHIDEVGVPAVREDEGQIVLNRRVPQNEINLFKNHSAVIYSDTFSTLPSQIIKGKDIPRVVLERTRNGRPTKVANPKSKFAPNSAKASARGKDLHLKIPQQKKSVTVNPGEEKEIVTGEGSVTLGISKLTDQKPDHQGIDPKEVGYIKKQKEETFDLTAKIKAKNYGELDVVMPK